MTDQHRSARRPLPVGPRPGRERRDPAATRQALVQAGAELFSERGFDGVSTEDVASRAGVNKALISYHFRGKRGLYEAVIGSVFEEIAGRLEVMEASAGDARAVLAGILATFESLAREHQGFPTLFLREVLETGLSPRVLPHVLRIVGISRRLAERGAREGLFRRTDPMLLHFGLFGSLVFFFATEPARQEARRQAALPVPLPDAKSFLRHMEQLTLRGLAPEKARPPGARRKGART